MSADMDSKRAAQGVQSQTRQTQFLDVVTRDEATARFREHLRLAPLGSERVPLSAALDRILADDVVSSVDVPGFDNDTTYPNPNANALTFRDETGTAVQYDSGALPDAKLLFSPLPRVVLKASIKTLNSVHS